MGLLIERLQPLLLLLTQHSCCQQTLIGCLGFIPFPPYLVPFHRFFAQMHHGLEQVVVEPHPLIEGVACCNLLCSSQSQLAKILAHQGIVFLLHMAVIMLLVWAAPREGESCSFLFSLQHPKPIEGLPPTNA